MRYVSVCSGIEAATVAWHPLGWRPLLFAEIADFPSRVLAHHYPEVPNAGDFTAIPARADCDLLVGGTPCQSFSLAGLRRGLSDDRGNLALEFMRLADRLRPRWIVWENVPGVLSSNGGRDFGSILGALGELGYGFAYRVLDAQFFGVAQRRRRVFVVGYLGDWRRAAAVLLERESVRGNPPPARSEGGRWWNGDDVSQTLDAVLSKGQMLPEKNRFPVVLERPRGSASCSPPSVTKTETAHDADSISATARVLARLKRIGLSTANAAVCSTHGDLRRLTPLECERLQGFPDGYTAIAGASGSARYAALGNSMAVPVMRWIGKQIASVDRLEDAP